MVGYRLWFSHSEVDQGLIALDAAYSKERPLESRITKLQYAPYRTTRGPGQRDVNESELGAIRVIAAGGVKKETNTRRATCVGKGLSVEGRVR